MASGPSAKMALSLGQPPPPPPPPPRFLPAACFFASSSSSSSSPGVPQPRPLSPSGGSQPVQGSPGASSSSSSSAAAKAPSPSPSAGAPPPPKRPPRSSSPELMRCKRRLNFSGFGYSLPQQQPAAVARRNERERNRVKLVNLGFATLREHVPNGAANKKMSKVETLRSAVEYIRALQQLLDEHDAVSAAFQAGVLSPAAAIAAAAAAASYPSDMNSMAGSPVSSAASSSSDEGSYDPLSPEEQELLDFASWF